MNRENKRIITIMVFSYCRLKLKSLNPLFEAEVIVVLDWHEVDILPFVGKNLYVTSTTTIQFVLREI